MDYKFSCTECGQHIATTAEMIGWHANCPSCNADITIPAPNELLPPLTVPPPLPSADAQQTQQQKATGYFRRIIDAGRSSSVVTDLRQVDFRGEVLPLNEHSFALIKSDFVFWSVTLLAIIPLILGTLNQAQAQLTGFCLFFAAIWGLVFKKFVVEENGGWGSPIAALFFTGLIGIPSLLYFYDWFPDFFRKLPESDDAFYNLIGQVFYVGLGEELCKIVPVLIYIAWKRQDARPLTIILVGVFSGLGFAAFENQIYANQAVYYSAFMSEKWGRDGLEAGVQNAMVNVMLRSMSCVFGHAVYTGIFSYFIAVGWLTKNRRVALALIGLAVASLIHGCYNWFTTVQNTLPAVVTAFGFMLFYAYLTKLRLLIASATLSSAASAVVNVPVESKNSLSSAS